MTYTQTTDKNGKARFYRIDENGKRKVISRAEYEAHTTANAEQGTESTEHQGETVYTAEPIPEKPCTALAVPFSLETAITELRQRQHLDSIDMAVPSIEETALETVKAIISGMEGKHSNKIRLNETKKAIQIRYRNCAVCALVFNAEHVLTGIRFTGTTMETVNEVTVCEPAGLDTYADKIVEHVTFIDYWWANCSKKTA